MLLSATLWPVSRNATASFAWLFETHISGRIGSPIVTGSTNSRRSSSRVGSFSIRVGPPPPGRRTSPDNEPGLARSFKPRPIVLRATPVARDAAAMPPWPAVLASAAASRRRDRSFRSCSTAVNRSRITDVSIIPRVYGVPARAGISLTEDPATGTSRDSLVFGHHLRRVVAPDIRHRTLVGEYRKRATMHGAHWAICGGGG